MSYLFFFFFVCRCRETYSLLPRGYIFSMEISQYFPYSKWQLMILVIKMVSFVFYKIESKWRNYDPIRATIEN